MLPMQYNLEINNDLKRTILLQSRFVGWAKRKDILDSDFGTFPEQVWYVHLDTKKKFALKS